MVQTNRINYTLNIESLNRDFFVIAFSTCESETTGKLEYLKYADFYDALDVEPGVAGLVFKGKHGYLLADKNVVTPKKLLETLGKTDSLKQYEFNKGTMVDSEINLRNYDLYGYWIVKLLLDSLGYRQMKLDAYKFSNLSSALYLIPQVPQNAGFLDAWQVDFKKNQSLTIGRTRFAKVTCLDLVKKDEPLFVLHTGTRTLKRVNRKSIGSNIEIWAPFKPKNKRATSIFADLDNPFSEDSKMGIWVSLYKLMQQHLSQYVEFSLDSIGVWESLIDLPHQKDSEKHFPLQRAVSLVESVALESLVSENTGVAFLEKHLLSTGLRIDPSSLSKISIVPDPDSLEKGEKDPYEWAEGVQHVIVENLRLLILKENDKSKNRDAITSAVISKLVIETAVKKDIMEKTLAFAPELALGETYRVGFFVTEKYQKVLSSVCVMEITSAGRISFSKIQASDNFEQLPEDWVRYQKSFNEIGSQDFFKATEIAHWQAEGFIENSQNEITVILKTDYHTLPNIEEWSKAARKVSTNLPSEMNTIQGIVDTLSETKDPELILLCDFFKSGVLAIRSTPKFHEPASLKKQKLQGWLKEIETDQNALIDKDIFKQILASRFSPTSTVRKSAAAFLESKGVLFSISRSRENKENLLSAKIGFKVCSQTILGREGIFYYTGWPIEKGIKATFPKASIVRLAWPTGEHPPFFRELAKTFLPWIRADESTVLPGALKYLREYMKRYRTDP